MTNSELKVRKISHGLVGELVVCAVLDRHRFHEWPACICMGRCMQDANSSFLASVHLRSYDFMPLGWGYT